MNIKFKSLNEIMSKNNCDLNTFFNDKIKEIKNSEAKFESIVNDCHELINTRISVEKLSQVQEHIMDLISNTIGEKLFSINKSIEIQFKEIHFLYESSKSKANNDILKIQESINDIEKQVENKIDQKELKQFTDIISDVKENLKSEMKLFNVTLQNYEKNISQINERIVFF